jgi:hypothetical protein
MSFVADPSGGYVADPLGGFLGSPLTGALSSLSDHTVYLFTFTEAYSNMPTNPFAGHLPGGTIVVAVCTDVTHAFVLGSGGTTATIY